MRHRCRCCLGEYDAVQADGQRYVHVCPPIANPHYQPDPGRPGFDPRETIERTGRRDENTRHVYKLVGAGAHLLGRDDVVAPGAGVDDLVVGKV